MSNVKNQMSNVKCQRSIRLNFCHSVPPELLWSFFISAQTNKKKEKLKFLTNSNRSICCKGDPEKVIH